MKDEDPKLTNYIKLANDYGWDEEIANLVYNSTLAEYRNEVKSIIWKDLGKPENQFPVASFNLANEVLSDLNKTSISDRSIVKSLVSTERTTGAFKFGQYIRELVQNAIDVRQQDSGLLIEFELNDNGMTFSHNGRSFKGISINSPTGEMAALYQVGRTTKKGNFNTEGKFGIGFKGWMMFFSTIEHKHTDGENGVRVKYSLKNETLQDVIIEGPKKVKMSINDCKTEFIFSDIQDKEQISDITCDKIVEEWRPMIRFLDCDVDIKINCFDECIKLTHKSKENTEHNLEPEFKIFQMRTFTDNHKPGFYKCNSCDTEKNHSKELLDNFPNFCDGDEDGCGEFGNFEYHPGKGVNENVLAINSEIQKSDEIDEAVESLINEQHQNYEDMNSPTNPWKDVTIEDWYDSKSIFFGIDWSAVQIKSPFLYSMAEISYSGDDHWDNENKSNLIAPENSNWIFNGPFFINPERTHLVDDIFGSEANVNLVTQILSRLVGNLFSYLCAKGYEKKLSLSTPFDFMLLKESNPNSHYSRILYNGKTKWSYYIDEPKPYSEIFGGKSIFINSQGQIISADKIKRIPEDLWVDEGETSLITWLNDNDKCSKFPSVPAKEVTSEGERSWRFVSEHESKFLHRVPEYSIAELKEILEKEEIISELISEKPERAEKLEWILPEIPNNAKAVVIGDYPASKVFVDFKNYLSENEVLFSTDEKINSAYSKFKSDCWFTKKQTKFLSLSTNPDDGKTMLSEKKILELLVDYCFKEDLNPPSNLMLDYAAFFGDLDSKYFVCDSVRITLNQNLSNSFEESSVFTVKLSASQIELYDPKYGKRWKKRKSFKPSNYIWVNSEISEWESHSYAGSVLVSDDFKITNDNVILLLETKLFPSKILNSLMKILYENSEDIPHDLHLLSPIMNINADSGLIENHAFRKIPNITIRTNLECYKDSLFYCDSGYFRERDSYPNYLEKKYRSVSGQKVSKIDSWGNFYSFRWSSNRSRFYMIRNLGLIHFVRHQEFNNDVYDSELLLQILLNGDLMGDRDMSATFVNLTLRKSADPYILKYAKLRTHKQPNPPQNYIGFDETETLINEDICVFTKDNFEYSMIENWIFIPTFDNIVHTNMVNDLISYIDSDDDLNLIKIYEKEVTSDLQTLPIDVKRKLSSSVNQLLASLVNSNQISDHLEACALLIQKLDYSMTDEEANEISIFSFSENENSGLSNKAKETIESLIPAGVEQSHLAHLRNNIKDIQTKTWDEIEWNENEGANVQFKRLVELGIMPTPEPLFNYRKGKFVRNNRYSKVKNDFFFVTKQDAEKFLQITKVSENEHTSNSWNLDPGRDRIFVLEDRMSKIVDAENCSSIPSKIDFKLFTQDIEFENSEISETTFNGKWDYVRLLVGLLSIQYRVSSSSQNASDYIPNVREGEETTTCDIINNRVMIGQRGWTINKGAGKNYLEIITSNLNFANKNNLRFLLRKLGLKGQLLSSFSFVKAREDQNNYSLLIESYDFDENQEKIAYEMLDCFGEKVFNPWNKNDLRKWQETFETPLEFGEQIKASLDRQKANSMQKEYTKELTMLLRRGDLGPTAQEINSIQYMMLNSGEGTSPEKLRQAMYRDIVSVVIDEPIIYIPQEGSPKSSYPTRKSGHEQKLIREAGLSRSLGNMLYLGRTLGHRATMTTDEYGLRESTFSTISESVKKAINSETQWGGEDKEFITLREVMQVGEGNLLTLRLHKYHAICMLALDSALENIRNENS